MSRALDRLTELAAARDAARAALTGRITEAKQLAHPSTLAKRAAKRAQAEVTTRTQSLTHQAMEIASDNRGLIVGVGVALVGWLVRAPLLGKASALLDKYTRGSSPDQTPPTDADPS